MVILHTPPTIAPPQQGTFHCVSEWKGSWIIPKCQQTHFSLHNDSMCWRLESFLLPCKHFGYMHKIAWSDCWLSKWEKSVENKNLLDLEDGCQQSWKNSARTKSCPISQVFVTDTKYPEPSAWRRRGLIWLTVSGIQSMVSGSKTGTSWWKQKCSVHGSQEATPGNNTKEEEARDRIQNPKVTPPWPTRHIKGPLY